MFDNPAHHEAIIRALSKQSIGFSRNEIIAATSLSTGGTVTKVLSELEGSGFITACIPIKKTADDPLFKLTDEYWLFYMKFIDKSRAIGSGTWVPICVSTSYRRWNGYAIKAICFKQNEKIKTVLGPSSYAEESFWRFCAIQRIERSGAQIDLLLDQRDDTISIVR